MKKLFFIPLLLLGLFSSCEENDIALYGEEPRVEIAEENLSYEFNDIDYLNQTEEKEFKVKVRIIGRPLSAPMQFCLKSKEEENVASPEVIFANPYTFPADSMEVNVTFKLKSPKVPKNDKKAILTFDTENQKNQLKVGRKEYTSIPYTATMDIKDNRWSWDIEMWGLYSTNKYRFMMDTLHQTYDQMTHTKETVKEVADAYEKYREEGNPPLMDDEKDPVEIFFPVED